MYVGLNNILFFIILVNVIKQSFGDKLHIEFNSITKLFHPHGIIRYCLVYFGQWLKITHAWSFPINIYA